jgi:hypothetical protein
MKIDDTIKYEKMATNRITKENYWTDYKVIVILNITSFKIKIWIQKDKNKLSNRVSKSVEIDETEIAHCRSERNWTKLDEIFHSILFISVAFS